MFAGPRRVAEQMCGRSGKNGPDVRIDGPALAIVAVLMPLSSSKFDLVLQPKGGGLFSRCLTSPPCLLASSYFTQLNIPQLTRWFNWKCAAV
jgi:hypothetical protein